MDFFLPRPYQSACIKAVLSRHEAEESQSVIELPPGAGKTLISGAILKEVLHPNEYGLFVVPWLHLVEQTHKVLARYFFSPWDVGIVQGSKNQVGRHITVASADTLRQPGRLEQLLAAQGRPKVSAVVYDECQRALSDTYRHIDTALSPYALKLGASATPYRADRKSLLPVFPHDISYSISFFDLISQGYLVNYRCYDVETDLDLTKGEVEGLDDEEIKKLSPAIYKKLQAANSHARSYEVWQELTKGEMRTLAFGQDIPDTYAWMDYYKARGVPCDIITGKMGTTRRDSILEQFRKKEILVLFNYDVFSTGADMPWIECVMMNRITNQGHWIQCVGRGGRLCPEIGKKECLLINLVDQHHSLVTMGRLIGVEGDTILSLKKTMKEKVEAEDEDEREVVTLEEKEDRPFSLSVKVEEVRVKAYNVLCGAGWTMDSVTGDFHKDCKEYGTLDAFRTFVGYSVRHRSKGGRISWISRDPVEADRARAMAHEHVERLKNTSAKRNGNHPDLVKPITKGQWQHLSQRHVSGIGKEYQEGLDAGLLQTHYFQIEAHLKEHGAVYSKTGGRIKYDPITRRVRTIAVKVTGTR